MQIVRVQVIHYLCSATAGKFISVLTRARCLPSATSIQWRHLLGRDLQAKTLSRFYLLFHIISLNYV